METPHHISWRDFSRRIVMVCFGLLLVPAWALNSAPLLRGNVFAVPRPAADFILTDQQGRPFHMADTRGKVVVLSFLYTHCTDFCPFVALKLKESVKLLGEDAAGLVVVPVTTDPQRDTLHVLGEYSKALGMYDTWRFVTGSLPTMRKVWKDYYIGVERETDLPSAATPAMKIGPQADQHAEDESEKVARGLSDEDKTDGVGRIIDKFGGGYEVSHDIPFWMVDKRGMMRVSLDADATPAEIAFDVRALLAEVL
jgi:cytochrome oxidase Cu insertion factor (SCO1/SenC/PrrC family)